VLAYYAFCAFFGALTLLLESEWFKFVALGVMGLLVIFGFALVARARNTDSTTSS
jgi:hypothetical protein